MILLFTVFGYVAFGQPRSAVTQVEEKPKEKPKKEKAWLQAPEKPNETVSAAWAPVKLDHYFGIRGGYGMGSGRFEPVKQMTSYMGLYNFGISYKLDMVDKRHRFVGAIEFDLEYMERGFQYETYYESGIFYSRRYSTITLPILWQPYLPFTKTGESRLYLNAGPSLGYAIESSYKTVNTNINETTDEGVWSYDMLRDNRFEYGIVAGAGVVVAIKRKVLIGVDFRYNIMLSDTFKGVTKYEGNPFRSPVDVMNLSLKIEYRFEGGKKKK